MRNALSRDMSYTPERIAELRRKLELSQDQLAEKLGVNRSNVSRWERGETRPRGPVCKLLDTLGTAEVAA